MKSMRFLSVGLLLSMFAWGCSQDKQETVGQPQIPQKQEPVLAGPEWTLVELNGKTLPEGARPPTLRVMDKDSMLAGFSGVNTYRAAYKLEGEKINISHMASTMMAGPENAMKLEHEYSQAMAKVNTWRIADGQLELSDGDQIVAKFRVREGTVEESPSR